MITLKEMSHNDVHLRYNGTWTCFRSGEKLVTMYVTDLITDQHNAGQYYDTDVVSVRGFSNGKETTIEPDELLPVPGTLGYVVHDGEILFLSRIPERQSRAGLPPHSIRVFSSNETSLRLNDYGVQAGYNMVKQILEGARVCTALTAAIKLGHGIISHELCYNKGKLYGPELLCIGSVSTNDGEVLIKTEHPKTVQRLLGEAHAHSG